MPHHLPLNTSVFISYKQEQPPTDPQYIYLRKFTDITFPFNLQTPTVQFMSFIGVVELCTAFGCLFSNLLRPRTVLQPFLSRPWHAWRLQASYFTECLPSTVISCLLMIKLWWCLCGSNIMKQCCGLLTAFYLGVQSLPLLRESVLTIWLWCLPDFTAVNLLFSF